MSLHSKQADRILRLLESQLDNPGSFNHEWVPLPKILSLGIASHTRRVSDLRKQGHKIECRSQWVDGQRRTAYRLVR